MDENNTIQLFEDKKIRTVSQTAYFVGKGGADEKLDHFKN